jgi:colicin import membrane protein
MNQSSLASFLLSLCLHAAIFGAALLWPSARPPMLNLNATVIELGQYTLGAPGKKAAPQPPDKPAAPETRPATPESAPKPALQPDQPSPPRPDPPQEPPAKPISPVAEQTPPKPPRANATTPAARTVQANAARAPAAQARPQPRPEEVLQRALGDLRGAQPRSGGGGQGRPDPNSVAKALGDFGRAGDGDAGTGPGGEGGDGIGIRGTYEQSLVSRIRPFWEYGGRADRRNPVALARIKIGVDGTILSAAIEKSSGDASFDGSVLKAIRDTEKVEAPPRPDLREVVIGFAYEALAGTL